MTMSLPAMDESPSGSIWAETDIEKLRGCVNRFAVELNKISQHIKDRTMFQKFTPPESPTAPGTSKAAGMSSPPVAPIPPEEPGTPADLNSDSPNPSALSLPSTPQLLQQRARNEFIPYFTNRPKDDWRNFDPAIVPAQPPEDIMEPQDDPLDPLLDDDAISFDKSIIDDISLSDGSLPRLIHEDISPTEVLNVYDDCSINDLETIRNIGSEKFPDNDEPQPSTSNTYGRTSSANNTNHLNQEQQYYSLRRAEETWSHVSLLPQEHLAAQNKRETTVSVDFNIKEKSSDEMGSSQVEQNRNSNVYSLPVKGPIEVIKNEVTLPDHLQKEDMSSEHYINKIISSYTEGIKKSTGKKLAGNLRLHQPEPPKLIRTYSRKRIYTANDTLGCTFSKLSRTKTSSPHNIEVTGQSSTKYLNPVHTEETIADSRSHTATKNETYPSSNRVEETATASTSSFVENKPDPFSSISTEQKSDPFNTQLIGAPKRPRYFGSIYANAFKTEDRDKGTRDPYELDLGSDDETPAKPNKKTGLRRKKPLVYNTKDVAPPKRRRCSNKKSDCGTQVKSTRKRKTY